MLFMLMFLGLLPAGLAYAGAGADEGRGGGERDSDAHDADADDAAPPAGEPGAAGPPADLLDLMGPLAASQADPAATDADGVGGDGADAASAEPGSEQSDIAARDEAESDEFLPDASDPEGAAGYGVDELEGGGRLVRLEDGSGDVSIAGFQPGVDRVEVHLAPDEARFEAITDPENGAPGLRISGEDDDRQILFPGLDRLPVDDMLFTRGEGDLLAGYRLQEMTDSEPLFPLPGDGVETTTPADGDEDPGAALLPLDPDTDEVPTPGDDTPALEPLPGDTEEVPTPAASGLGLVAEPEPEPPAGGDARTAPPEDTPPRAAA